VARAGIVQFGNRKPHVDLSKRQAALADRGLDFADASIVSSVRRSPYRTRAGTLARRVSSAEIRHGDKIIKRGRPPLENPKEAVKLRLDHDVLTAYRKTGTGWQTRINADLRKAARKLAG
jgi:uncharacterized protein (DUF4415 family)